MLRLRALGSPCIERDGEALDGAARQRRVLALLTILADAGARGVSRDRVLALLWSESDADRARQALTQGLYHARRALGDDQLFKSTADLALNPSAISSDVGDFQDAITRGDWRAAADLYVAPFLDGFFLSSAPEFERWTSERRRELQGSYTSALENLAAQADEGGDHSLGLEWKRRLVVVDPLNSRFALEYMRALAASGDRAGAIRHAAVHETLLREEVGAVPHPAITAFAEQLRRETQWTPTAAPAALNNLVEQTSLASADNLSAIGAEARPVPDGSNTSATPIVRRRRWQRSWRAVAAGLVGVIVIAMSAVWATLSRENPKGSGDLVVVVPFRVAGADRALAYLREGLVDLLAAKLSEDDVTQVADPGAVMSAWQRAGLDDRRDVAREEAIQVARSLGGGRVLLGSVVGTSARMVINASLIATATGKLRAQASAEAPADSLTIAVDHLIARLLATEAGEGDRLANHTTPSSLALRAYLDGQVLRRRGRYRDALARFEHALTIDHSFALAALGLAVVAQRIGNEEERERGLSAAWNARAELSDRDSTFLAALAGPRYPRASTPRERLAAWERAASVAADRADVWEALGETLFHDGRMLAIPDWDARAQAAFRRAAALDRTFATPQLYLLQLAAVRGDTAAVRTTAASYSAVDSGGDFISFARWRAAVARGDRAAPHVVRQRMDSATAASLRMTILSSMYNALAPDDAHRAIEMLQSRAVRGRDHVEALLARHALAMNEGDRTSASEQLDALEGLSARSSTAWRLRLLDALYDEGDTVRAASAYTKLSARLARFEAGTAPISAADSNDVADFCVAGQWRAWHADSTGAERAADALRALPFTSDPAWGSLCATLIDAASAIALHSPSAPTLASQLDSLASAGISNSEGRDYAPLAISRVFERLGEYRRALAAVRRRPYMRPWPHYLSAHWKAEGALAALTADTTGARVAYRQFLNLRKASSGRDTAVRAALSALGGR